MIARAASRRGAITVIGFASILALCLGVFGCGGESDDGSEAVMTDAARPDSVATTDETGLPVLLDLGSTTCVPCKAMAPRVL